MKAALGGRAIRQAITRVKPEQASKGKSRMPTRLMSELVLENWTEGLGVFLA